MRVVIKGGSLFLPNPSRLKYPAAGPKDAFVIITEEGIKEMLLVTQKRSLHRNITKDGLINSPALANRSWYG